VAVCGGHSAVVLVCEDVGSEHVVQVLAKAEIQIAEAFAGHRCSISKTFLTFFHAFFKPIQALGKKLIAAAEEHLQCLQLLCHVTDPALWPYIQLLRAQLVLGDADVLIISESFQNHIQGLLVVLFNCEVGEVDTG